MAAVLALLFVPIAAHAEWPTTRADFATLPKYCAARMASELQWVPQAQYDLWRKRMGPDFIHVHHYCTGLFALRRARAALDERERRALLNSALTQMRYTKDHASPQFLLQPEVRTQMSKVQLELGNPAAAIELCQSAIKLRPTYTPAYAALADALLKTGQRDEARKVLKAGLEHRPGSKLLKRRLARLDVREP